MPTKDSRRKGKAAASGATKAATKPRRKPHTKLAKAQAEQAAREERDRSALRGLLRVGPGFTLADVDPAGTPGFTDLSGRKTGKKSGAEALAAEVPELADLQERLWAESRGGGTRSLLLVVQGMDTAGKGGIMQHVVGSVDPQGVRHTAFKAPTPEERAKGFLWRIRQALPRPGEFGVFDRSHYEDVLVVRVHDLVPRAVWQRRYATINAFEQRLAANGTTVVKVMLHVSPKEQKRRLAARLEDPAKYWKYNPRDVDERGRWDDYQQAYQVALTRCSTAAAPWFVVPADHKWYARWAVQRLLLEHLRELAPTWPPATFDVPTEQSRLAQT